MTLASSADTLEKPGTVGRAVEGAELRILDDDGRILPAGEVGEIFTRFAELPDFTYHNRPDERAKVDRDGFITSGDVGYLDADGYLFLCDRKRDMVISGGVNIYPAEIEAALHAMPGVKDCAVFGIPDAEFGEKLMAVVEPADGAVVTPPDVSAYLRAHLADYKVPKAIEIARNLPREDSGKSSSAGSGTRIGRRKGGEFSVIPVLVTGSKSRIRRPCGWLDAGDKPRHDNQEHQ